MYVILCKRILFIYLFVCLLVRSFVCLSVYLFIYLFIYLFVCLFVYHISCVISLFIWVWLYLKHIVVSSVNCHISFLIYVSTTDMQRNGYRYR